MLPIERILWATDFSDASCHALDVAVELALLHKATLLCLHVYRPLPIPDPELAETGEFGIPLTVNEKCDQLEAELINQVRQHVPVGIDFTTMITVGNASDEILGVAGSENVDLLVIATRNLSIWRRLLFGSVAEIIIRKACCPVLVIHVASNNN